MRTRELRCHAHEYSMVHASAETYALPPFTSIEATTDRMYCPTCAGLTLLRPEALCMYVCMYVCMHVCEIFTQELDSSPPQTSNIDQHQSAYSRTNTCVVVVLCAGFTAHSSLVEEWKHPRQETTHKRMLQSPDKQACYQTWRFPSL